ncbi:MAG: aldose 1-epimerase family protein [Clostridia bacterium]|nr:aldose 1-epimerase family protein [Clostridia bacterium]
MKFSEEQKYVGNLSQLFDVRDCRLVGGRADGVRATTVKTGGGLEFTVLADRCMDIADLSFNGVNCALINPCGIVAPQYYDDKGAGWLKSFTAGFLTTCGLSNFGVPSAENGKLYGMHGAIGNTPAEHYSVNVDQNENGASVTMRGRMIEAGIFSPKLYLNRTIRTSYQSNCITLIDEVENNGYDTEYFMLLYHFNIGYPFLSPDTELHLPTTKVTPRDEDAEVGFGVWDRVFAPVDHYPEQVFFHELEGNKDNVAAVKLINRKLGIGMTMRIDLTHMDHFIQWKNFESGEYVMGLEPANSSLGGRAVQKKLGDIKTIAPKSKVRIVTEIEFEKLI